MLNKQDYPEVFDRVKAIAVDSVVLVGFIFGVTHVFALFENVPEYARIVAFVIVFLLYDPLFTSLFGGTIGHMLTGIRVKDESDEQKNIMFPLAILRFLAKTFLGVISLFTVMGSEKGKAIHDHLVGSVVIFSKRS